MTLPKLAEVRKTVAAVVGILAQALALGLLPVPYSTWATAVLAFATVAGVYQVKNEPVA